MNVFICGHGSLLKNNGEKREEDTGFSQETERDLETEADSKNERKLRLEGEKAAL